MTNTPAPKIGSPEFFELQRKWYAKANKCRCTPRCPGRCDLAIATDPPPDTWTFSGGDGPDHSPHLSSDAPDFNLDDMESRGLVIELTTHHRAEFWRQVGFAVNGLPRNYKHRAFLLATAESGNLAKEARRHGLTPEQARWAFKKVLTRVGLARSPMGRI